MLNFLKNLMPKPTIRIETGEPCEPYGIAWTPEELAAQDVELAEYCARLDAEMEAHQATLQAIQDGQFDNPAFDDDLGLFHQACNQFQNSLLEQWGFEVE